MTAAEPDKLAERVGKIRDRVTHILAVASPSPALTRANEGAYAALETLLAVHSLTALHRHTEACPQHHASIHGRRECPDCVVVEWTGCDRCRDEYGNPARPEDCEVRKIIAGRLTRTIDEASIDAAVKSAADSRWEALQADLTARINSDYAVAQSVPGTEVAAAHFSLVSANRTTLAKMRELERS